MDHVRSFSSLEATGVPENDVQVLMPVSDDELVVPTMAGFGTPEVPLDGSRFEACRFSVPTCHEHADPVAPRPEPSQSSMTKADLASAMDVLMLLSHSGQLQRMVAKNKYHDGSFTHAQGTHEPGIASSSTNPFQSVSWRSNVTYVTASQPHIHGEPIVNGVPTGVPEPKFFSEPHAPEGPQVFQASASAEESTILLSTLQQLKGRLENLENRTSANLTTNPCVPYHPSPLTRVCTGLARVPPGVKLPMYPVRKHPNPLRASPLPTKFTPSTSPRPRTWSTSAYGTTPRPHTTGATDRWRNQSYFQT